MVRDDTRVPCIVPTFIYTGTGVPRLIDHRQNVRPRGPFFFYDVLKISGTRVYVSYSDTVPS